MYCKIIIIIYSIRISYIYLIGQYSDKGSQIHIHTHTLTKHDIKGAQSSGLSTQSSFSCHERVRVHIALMRIFCIFPLYVFNLN
jgi:hypothetical protein